MNRMEILDFVNKNPVCFLGTSESDQPSVRAMMTFRADNDGIVFCTGKAKDLCRQMERNPAVELCYISPAKDVQVRIRGKVEPVHALETKKEAVEKFPFLKPWIDRDGYGILALFCLRKGTATVWSKDAAFDPKAFVEF